MRALTFEKLPVGKTFSRAAGSALVWLKTSLAGTAVVVKGPEYARAAGVPAVGALWSFAPTELVFVS